MTPPHFEMEMDTRPPSPAEAAVDPRTSHQESDVEETHSPAEIEQRSLPPTDSGKDAYIVLASCSLLQFPIWGMHRTMQIG